MFNTIAEFFDAPMPTPAPEPEDPFYYAMYLAPPKPKKTMFSKKRLLAFLEANGFKPRAGYEAYGRKVEAYIGTGSFEERARLEKLLTEAGQKVDKGYDTKRFTVAVQVTYFKAWHWDE
jgi:hypothetical protein